MGKGEWNPRCIDLFDLRERQLYFSSVDCAFRYLARVSFEIYGFQGGEMFELRVECAEIRNFVSVQLEEGDVSVNLLASPSSAPKVPLVMSNGRHSLFLG